MGLNQNPSPTRGGARGAEAKFIVYHFKVGGGWGVMSLRAIILISVCLRPQAKHKPRCWVFIPGDVTVWVQGKEGLRESSGEG